MVVVCLHLAFLKRERNEVVFLLAATTIGSLMDVLQGKLGLLLFVDGTLLPPWLAALWCIFATTFGISLRWARR